MKRNQWRTVGVAGGGMLCLGWGLYMVAHWPPSAVVFPAYVGGVVACVGAVAAKAFGEHKVNPEPLK